MNIWDTTLCWMLCDATIKPISHAHKSKKRRTACSSNPRSNYVTIPSWSFLPCILVLCMLQWHAMTSLDGWWCHSYQLALPPPKNVDLTWPNDSETLDRQPPARHTHQPLSFSWLHTTTASTKSKAVTCSQNAVSPSTAAVVLPI